MVILSGFFSHAYMHGCYAPGGLVATQHKY